MQGTLLVSVMGLTERGQLVLPLSAFPGEVHAVLANDLLYWTIIGNLMWPLVIIPSDNVKGVSGSMTRIAIYARVSTTDKGQDTENQLRELRQFVANKAAEGWATAGEYVDQASGKNANRPEFQRLFRDAAERKFDQIGRAHV